MLIKTREQLQLAFAVLEAQLAAIRQTIRHRPDYESYRVKEYLHREFFFEMVKCIFHNIIIVNWLLMSMVQTPKIVTRNDTVGATLGATRFSCPTNVFTDQQLMG